MAIVYFDSSAFVKLLVDEDGSDLAAVLWDGCDAAVSSRLAYPEVRAALAAASRAGRLDPDGRRRAEDLWEDYWASTRAVELTEAVSQHAGDLAGERSLRGADAVHLASMLAVLAAGTEGAEGILLAVWDRRLRVGARAAGIRVLPEDAD